MKIFISIFFFFIVANSFAQHEHLLPINGNPTLMAKSINKVASKLNAGTFDSTFVYISDTLTLPLFDDFSSNKFQTYSAAYSDPGVTSIKEYRLLDLSSTPLPNDVLYTQQQTFKRTFDIGNGEYTDTLFTSIEIQVADMTTYPSSYSTIDVYPPFYIYDTLDFPNDPDTLWINDAEIYQDSATQFFKPVSDQELYWLESEAYHNYTFAVNPWTLGVATFDGIDETGYPYAINTSTSGFADHLTSKPIDMSSNLPSDSIYLSFLYQAEGFGDVPENGDSLILEFYNANTDVWDQVWSAGNNATTDFQVGHLKITSADYLSDHFQFRFKNDGALYGNLDHFHLDYVLLRPLSGYQDTVFKDFAFVYPVQTLLETYTSVPWDHYKNSVEVDGINRMNTSTRMVVRNGDLLPANNSNSGTSEIYYNGALEGSFVVPGSDLSNGELNYGPQSTYTSFHDFSGGYEFTTGHVGPEEKFEVVSSVSALYPNFNGNDTTKFEQVFSNYYAYDDGSAERAYGPDEAQAELAVRFDPYEADSLIGVKIHFVPHIEDVSNHLFLVTVWEDNNGVPGEVIYEDTPFAPRSPSYGYNRNIFKTYYFEDTAKIAVNGTFHIGFRQIDEGVLGVGFDANIINNDKVNYYIPSLGSWFGSSLSGSLMIRPVFSTSLDSTLGIDEAPVKMDALLYPNPVNDQLTIQMNEGEFNGAQVYNLQGKLILNTNFNILDMSSFVSGIYLVKVNGISEPFKIVKQ